MADEKTYEEKERRLDEILERLDRSETPMDQLAAETREAAQLLMEMQNTLKATKAEIRKVFAEMEEQKALLDSPEDGSAARQVG